MKKEFDKEERYKLYRRVNDLTHPTISKKNISEYKIVLEEDLFPVRVFYPNKVSNLDEVIIDIPGDGRITNCLSKYTDIYSELAICIDKLIIAIDYFEEEYNEDKIIKTVKYIYEELNKSGKKIHLFGDSNGGTIAIKAAKQLDKIDKLVLLYPLTSGDYSKKSKYESIVRNFDIHNEVMENIETYSKNYLQESLPAEEINKKMLILVGSLDPVLDENKEYATNCKAKVHVVEFASHGFMNTKDLSIKKDYMIKVKEFL